MQSVKAKVQSVILAFLRPLVHKILLTDALVWGPKDRLTTGEHVYLVNTLCNTSSGTITIGNNAVIAAGAVVKPNTIVPGIAIFAGVPAIEKKRIT